MSARLDRLKAMFGDLVCAIRVGDPDAIPFIRYAFIAAGWRIFYTRPGSCLESTDEHGYPVPTCDTVYFSLALTCADAGDDEGAEHWLDQLRRIGWDIERVPARVRRARR